jgi:KaiC/GvpD/RAD55 family RecA-like ATPase
MMFTKATKEKLKARIALMGPPGSGKTMSALEIAQGLGNRIAVIDTEHASASLYADLYDFDCCPISNFHPNNYIKAIKAADEAGYDVLIIDSLSHAWAGEGGVMDVVDNSRNKNKYASWAEGTKLQNQLVNAMLSCSAHLIVTMRTKMAYEQQVGSDGKKSVVKLGMAPVQRDGVEYEFTIVADIDTDHRLTVTKSRYSELQDVTLDKATPEFGQRILAWLDQGETPIKILKSKLFDEYDRDEKLLTKDAMEVYNCSPSELTRDQIVDLTERQNQAKINQSNGQQ